MQAACDYTWANHALHRSVYLSPSMEWWGLGCGLRCHTEHWGCRELLAWSSPRTVKGGESGIFVPVGQPVSAAFGFATWEDLCCPGATPSPRTSSLLSLVLPSLGHIGPQGLLLTGPCSTDLQDLADYALPSPLLSPHQCQAFCGGREDTP